jgi:glycosyltransferase involved in cell wall biosynthesis
MRVAFNARVLRDPMLRGWNRYLINLISQLPELGVELVLYTDQPLHEGYLTRLKPRTFQVRVAPPMRYLRWEQAWLPRQCAADRADVLHSPCNFGVPWSSPCPRVLTLHDAIDQVCSAPLQPWRERIRPRHLISRGRNWLARTCADVIITVSEHARGDLTEHLRLPLRKIMVIPEAADPSFHEPVSGSARRRVRATHKLAKNYIFYVGGWERRKNIPFLVRAFAQAHLEGVELVLAGGRPEQARDLDALAASLGVGGRVRFLNWVEDADLPPLYAEAKCFVYPSEYEGFGLQLCEAMAVGCPVLAARATALPEVLGDGGETFGLADVAELCGHLRRCVADGDFRAELSRRALIRSGQYSWRRTAEQTLAVYRAARKCPSYRNRCGSTFGLSSFVPARERSPGKDV